MRTYHVSLLLLFMIVLASCDRHVFGRSTKTIIGLYELEQWEDFKTHYLLGPQETGWGNIGGAVSKIGWNQRYILVLQSDDGNGGGLRIIDANAQSQSTLLGSAELQNHPEISGIKIRSGSSALNSL